MRLSGMAFGKAARVLAVIAAAASAGRSAVGQDRSSALWGVVRDTAGQPLPMVMVTVALQAERRAFTDSLGGFRLDAVPPGVHRVEFRRIGFVPAAFDVVVPPAPGRSVTVVLESLPLRLDTITVAGRVVYDGLARVGFYERQRQREIGLGTATFLGPEEIEARHALYTTQLLYGINGLHIVFVGSRPIPMGRTRQCVLATFVDGQEVELYEGRRGGPVGGIGLDLFIHPGAIRAIEVYPSGPGTPVQFQSTRAAGCGAIVIWTKVN